MTQDHMLHEQNGTELRERIEKSGDRELIEHVAGKLTDKQLGRLTELFHAGKLNNIR